jgi:hypothetical protein
MTLASTASKLCAYRAISAAAAAAAGQPVALMGSG